MGWLNVNELSFFCRLLSLTRLAQKIKEEIAFRLAEFKLSRR